MTEDEVERATALPGRIEFSAVGECADVVHRDVVAGTRGVACPDGDVLGHNA
jgi:hypothetical protein